MKITILILLVCSTGIRPQTTTSTLKPELLASIFDNFKATTTTAAGAVGGAQAQPSTTSQTPAVTGQPTQSNEGQCMCVPQNFCDHNGRMTIDTLVSGWGLTNPRVGDAETCQKGEVCCLPPRNDSSNLSSGNGAQDEQCKCVPYYYCDDGINLIHITNSSITGWGVTAPRLGETRICPESMEMCCKLPKNVTIIPTPTTTGVEVGGGDVRGCGQSNPNGIDFVIAEGSGKAGFAEYPWVVALLADNVKYIGVGVLIHPDVVMTAAHVVYDYRQSADRLKIRAGEWDTQTAKERLRHQERTVREVYVHRDFINVILFNDIALLRLVQPVVIAEHVNVLCLPQQNAVFDGVKDCVVNGWGKDVFGKKGNYAVILKKVKVNMVSDSACLEMLRKTKLGPQYLLHYNFVCAGGEEGEDSCEGDGGAPLACPTGNNTYVLTGLVSWGIGCGEKNVPGVYTKVSKFRDWVEEKVKNWGYYII